MNQAVEQGNPLRGIGAAGVLRGWRSRVVVLWMLGLMLAGLALVPPAQVARLTELFSHSATPGWAQVLQAVGLLVLAQLGVSICSYLLARQRGRLTELAKQGFTIGIFSRLLRLQPEYFVNRETERINTRMLEDTSRVVSYAVAMVAGTPVACCAILIFAVAMIRTHPLLGSIMLLMSLFSGYFVLFDRLIQRINNRTRDTWDAVRVRTGELVGGVQEIQSHHIFDFVLDYLRKSLREYSSALSRENRLNAAIESVNPLIETVQRSFLFAVGAALCMSRFWLGDYAGEMSWPQVIEFMLIAQLFQVPVNTLAMNLLQARMVRDSRRRLAEVVAQPVKEDAQMHDLPDERLTMACRSASVFSGETPILRDVDLQILSGQHVALCGPSGSGKSTLLKLLASQASLKSGAVRINGMDLNRISLDSLGRRIAMVPQQPVIWHMSIRNNLLLGLRRKTAPGQMLEDEMGVIDISGLSGVHDLEDLDSMLIQVAMDVGLDRDLMGLFLNHPMPVQLPDRLAHRVECFKQRIPQLCQMILTRVFAVNSQLIVPFSVDLYFNGSICENLFGPGYLFRHSAQDAAAWLQQLDRQCRLIHPLLFAGCRQLRHERRLVSQLRSVTSLGGLIGENLQQVLLGQSASLTDQLDPRQLPVAAQRSLLAVIIQMTVNDLVPGDQLPSMQQLILAIRQHAADQQQGDSCWTQLSSGQYLEGLPVRDNLLGGRINNELHGAQRQVDTVIHEVLVQKLFDDLGVLLGMNCSAGHDGRSLSGGQRQKLALARAILKNPDILLLDEPTASLDELSRRQVDQMLSDSRWAKRTIVHISHRLSSIRNYDQILVLDRGEIVQSGRFGELVRQPGVFRQLAEHEMTLPPLTQAQKKMAGARKRTDGLSVSDGLDIKRQLALCELFSHMDADQLEFLQRIAGVIQCPAQQILFEQGDVGSELFVIITGEVEFVAGRMADSAVESTVVGVAQAGALFGEVALFADGLRTLGARARTELTLCVIQRDDLLELVGVDPRIAMGIMHALAQRLAENLTRHQVDQGAQTPIAPPEGTSPLDDQSTWVME